MNDSLMNGSLSNARFSGLEIIVTPDPEPVRRQVRFPRSKGDRIRKKWKSDERNWAWSIRESTVPDGMTYRIGRRLIMNPRTYRAMRQAL